MPETKDRIFISIAVSKPGGGLEELPGAITAAERMATWAIAQGYATVLLHDAILQEITVEILRSEIALAIQCVTNRTELQRLVIFFAGHGASLAIGDQYWILTNWHSRPTEAIKVSSLQRMLEYYGPKQVSVIGDACQEFSSKFIDLVGSPVLDRPDEDQRPYELDQFFAVDVGKQAFMIKATNNNKDFCLFTEVLLDALEGDTQEVCFEEIDGRRVVTSQSLALYLDSNIAREAGKYGVHMKSRPKPGFYTDRIYLRMPSPIEDSAFGQPDSAGMIDEGTPESPPPMDKEAELSETAGLGIETEMLYRAVEKAKLQEQLLPPSVELVPSTDTSEDAQNNRCKTFFDEVERATVPDNFIAGCGICVSGTDVFDVKASFGKVSKVDGQPSWFHIELDTGDTDSLGWSDTLLTLADKRIVTVCSVNNFVAILHVIDSSTISLFHRPLHALEGETQQAIELLARAHSGLMSREEIINTATNLRYGKHRIITLGCIAAQFYDVIRDVDSLRSMAAFYAAHGQPVPLDIALFGCCKISEYRGRLYADIPAVLQRQPRTTDEARQLFTYSKSDAISNHPIAGRIPWMRQAWSAITTASYDESAYAWVGKALEAMKHLAPGTFTTAHASGHRAFLDLAGNLSFTNGGSETATEHRYQHL